ETAGMMGPSARRGPARSDPARRQLGPCAGLRGILATVRQRLAVLRGALDERAYDARQIDRLAQQLLWLDTDQPFDTSALVELAAEVLSEGSNQPLRFLAAPPTAEQAFLGG